MTALASEAITSGRRRPQRVSVGGDIIVCHDDSGVGGRLGCEVESE